MNEQDDAATVDLKGVDPAPLFRAAKLNEPPSLAKVDITAEVLAELLKDKYDRVRAMEAGGMACVFEAYHKLLKQWMVIKLPAPQYRTAEHIERFVVEAKAIYELRDQPNIVRFTEVGQVQGVPYFAMERVEGKSLSKVMASLSHDEKIRIGITVCEALAAVHRAKITHRDIKPDNIVITPAHQVKVIDFGIASMPEDSSGQTFAGSPGYKAPEQGSKRPVDHRADIYSLGVTLCEMFTDKLSLEPESYTTLARSLADAIAKATRHLPEERYQSMGELAAALRKTQTKGKPPPLPELNGTGPNPKPGSARKTSPPLVHAFMPLRFRHVALLLGFAALAFYFGLVNICFAASLCGVTCISRIAVKYRLASIVLISVGWLWCLSQPVSPRSATATKPFINDLGMKFVPLPRTSLLISEKPTTKAELDQWLVHDANVLAFAQSVSGRSHWSYEGTAMAVTWEEATAFANWLSKMEKRKYRLPSVAELLAAFGPDGCEMASSLTDARAIYHSTEPNRLGVKIVHYLWEWSDDQQVNNGIVERRLVQAEPRPDNQAVVFPMPALATKRSMLAGKPPHEVNDFAFRLVLEIESK